MGLLLGAGIGKMSDSAVSRRRRAALLERFRGAHPPDLPADRAARRWDEADIVSRGG